MLGRGVMVGIPTGLADGLDGRKTEGSTLLMALELGVKMSVAQSCLILCDPWTAAHQVPLSMGFSRQEY